MAGVRALAAETGRAEFPRSRHPWSESPFLLWTCACQRHAPSAGTEAKSMLDPRSRPKYEGPVHEHRTTASEETTQRSNRVLLPFARLLQLQVGITRRKKVDVVQDVRR